MKRNIYSYSKLWIIFFVLMGAACTNQVEDAIPVSGQPIEFSVQSDWKEILNTRNAGKTQFKAGDTIQIFGFHKSPSGEVKKFMYHVGDSARGQKVVCDSSNNWNYSPKRFWPKEGTLDFYASYPDYSVLNEGDKMTYVQPAFNPLGVDLLWGLATNRDCDTVPKKTVEIWMVHALAKVNISFDGFSDEIGSVIVSAYKTGWFSGTLDGGIPYWQFDDKTNIDAVFYKYGDKNLIINNSVTVFILPEKITGFQMFDVPGNRINASDEIFDRIKNLTFKAGKEYNLRISKGVQKKNTNSRSIAMSVRCVSE
ncbi:fimbrillin family protein [Segatella copri]|uniref:fimbrillin family protein n=1 Tax=Segatella copri TaxID=165179 RepID=UPI003F6F62CE